MDDSNTDRAVTTLSLQVAGIIPGNSISGAMRQIFRPDISRDMQAGE